MTCGTCAAKGDYGTVYFDHKARRWRHTEKEGLTVCTKPFPK